ncbi:hypothetical protein ACVGVM_15080 [Pseudonocardia bannensis]|uniref:hypothetical protein n=1 Tax=Pseudonocardia bannensis TaxID=630973 RepID=UPI0028AD7D79|nr:hypothetical protein [Pseudonocardia bannensis]
MTVDTAVVPTTQRGVLSALIAAYARHDPPRTITVVGNAPIPESAARAALIDDSDLVVRMTSFAVDVPGGPPRLGRRTDVVMVHRGVIAGPGTFADPTSRLYLLVEPGREHWEGEQRPAWWPRSMAAVSVSNREFSRPLNGLLGLNGADAVWATTGTLTTYLVSELFPAAVTRLTGISIVDAPEQTRFAHSWGEDVAVTPEHRLHAESALLRAWHAHGRIELVR